MRIAPILAVIFFLATIGQAKERKMFPATHDSVPAENRAADAAGLKRYEDEREIRSEERRVGKEC